MATAGTSLSRTSCSIFRLVELHSPPRGGEIKYFTFSVLVRIIKRLTLWSLNLSLYEWPSS